MKWRGWFGFSELYGPSSTTNPVDDLGHILTSPFWDSVFPSLKWGQTMPVQVAHSLVFKMSTTACWKAVVGTLWGRFGGNLSQNENKQIWLCFSLGCPSLWNYLFHRVCSRVSLHVIILNKSFRLVVTGSCCENRFIVKELPDWLDGKSLLAIKYKIWEEFLTRLKGMSNSRWNLKSKDLP